MALSPDPMNLSPVVTSLSPVAVTSSSLVFCSLSPVSPVLCAGAHTRAYACDVCMNASHQYKKPVVTLVTGDRPGPVLSSCLDKAAGMDSAGKFADIAGPIFGGTHAGLVIA